MSLHQKVLDGIEEIDAAIFTGCPEKEDIPELKSYCERWIRGLNAHEVSYKEIEEL